jgi:hypothetical protein
MTTHLSWIEHTLLDVVVNLLGCVDEGQHDVPCCLGRCFQEKQAILL